MAGPRAGTRVGGAGGAGPECGEHHKLGGCTLSSRYRIHRIRIAPYDLVWLRSRYRAGRKNVQEGCHARICETVGGAGDAAWGSFTC